MKSVDLTPFWLVAVAGLACRPALGEAFIARDGQPQAEIVIAEPPPRMVRLAASELQAYVERISGAKLPITTAASKDCPVQIYVGKSSHTARLKVADDGLADGAFRMVSGENWLALLGHDSDFTPIEPWARNHDDRERAQKEWDELTGARWSHPAQSVFKGYQKELGIWESDERGSLNAVYAFLRSLGVRWYMPGELGEVLPATKTIPLPQVDRTVRPDFAYRCLYFYYNSFFLASPAEALWQLRLGLNWRGSPGGHGIYNVLAHEKTKQAHPEYYRLIGGKRDTTARGSGSPCLSSEGLLRANVEFARALFDIYHGPLVSVMPTDGYVDLCQCDLCRGKGTPERGYEGQLSDYVWGYVDRVARELHKTHPDRKVSCYAYSAYLLPPEKIEKLSPNVVVGICQWRSEFHNAETRDKFRKLRQAWLGKLPSKELYIWDYYLHGRPGKAYEGLPAYFPHLVADDLRSLKGTGRGEGIEVYRTPGAKSGPDPALATNHLNCYVTARLWWDADQDVDALLAEYYRGFYGPAAGEMKAFVEYCEANWPRMAKEAAAIDQALELLAAARKAAGDTVHGRRIALVGDHIAPLRQLRDKLAMGRGDVPAARAYPRGRKDLKLDGKLDEEFWQNMASYSLRDLETGEKPASATSFRIAWADDDSLCFGIVCRDRDTKALNITATKHGDTNIWNGDCVEILLETQAHTYYQIAISPAGAVVDVDREKGINTLWSSGAEAACHTGDGFWSLEVRIPVAPETQAEVDPNNGVAGRRPSATHPWYFNLCRQRVRDDERELSAFSPPGKRSFHEVMKFGKLYMR